MASLDEDCSFQGPVIEKRDFHHPYTPYTIQETFMQTVYQVLEDSKIGILESPTGTGKSLSLICGSLTWLRDHKSKDLEDGLHWDEDSDEPAWIVEQAKARKRKELLRNRDDLEARLAKIRAKEKADRERYEKGEQKYKKRRTNADKDAADSDDEEQYVLEDYDSDKEQKSVKTGDAVFSAETMALMEKLGMATSSLKQEEEEVGEEETKIFYCSRTHSQLTQFINELHRVKFPPPTFLDSSADPSPKAHEPLKHLTLGSRKNLCINPSVNKLGSVTAINERCAELQQSSTPSDHKCQYLPNKDNQPLVNSFRDHALASIRDIEDMGALGKEIGICPYYASRAAIKPAEIVTLPYPLLLQKSAREALGIELKGHVVIIDEAHNLMDAIAGIHGVEITLSQLKRARLQLATYLQKFRNRLKGKNRVYVAQVVRVVDSLVGYLEGRLTAQKVDGIVDEKELLAGKGVNQINLYKLIKYLQESKLARKVESYALHTTTAIKSINSNPSRPTSKPEATTPVLHHLTSLLFALTHPTNEGRLFFAKDVSLPTTPSINLKFQLLDPSPHFAPLLSSARAIILAGGTMSPFSDYTSHLFPSLATEKLTTLSCGHVIPSSQLLAWNLSRGPSGKQFEFTHKSKNDNEMMDELGRALLNACTIVPDGVVVFFSSYSFLDSVVNRWSVPPPFTQSSSLSGTRVKSLYERLNDKKPIFRESKTESSETTLQAYAQSIDSNKGGLLLSVVGGKMSEGINFSDALGRCVVIVGLPYPNIMSAEWKAKMEYIESTTISLLEAENAVVETGGSINEKQRKWTKDEITKKAKDQAREYVENACMRAVNQSVGRAIRHRNDYAAVIMVDRRYEGQRIRGKLPGWIREGMQEGTGEKGFGVLMGRLGGFFRGLKDGK